MWGLLSRGQSRVAEAWAGLCPLPPARAGPEVSQPPGLDPKGNLADRAGTLGSDLQANGGAAIWTPKWRRRLRSKNFITSCDLFLYLSPPHKTVNIMTTTTVLLCAH